jgi:pimeloyl-ACP methyl ester carboxylesterase
LREAAGREGPGVSIRDVCQPGPALVVKGAGDAMIDSVNSHILQQNLQRAQLSLYPDSPHDPWSAAN